MDDLRQAIQTLGHQMAEEDNMAFNLWTWLPSYKIAQKNHGDYACEFRPCIHDLMLEACEVMSNYKDGKPFGEITGIWSDGQCPCGEYEHPKEDGVIES